MKNQTNTIQPTHLVFAVIKHEGHDKAHWNVIGAAWANRDGKGFSLKLNYLPLNGADIVVREPRDEAEAATLG